ncbi:hypothetical protein F4553_005838 [Allocatelliglobosispora scoriae]|uniref:DUF3710 domain-containing protein n=1 Tax=Allocatelliglobosispora scoriae TaxID=643052 RepID=A0A841BW70_9ACTN|nr:DUF3710 domain-containing protein [Allocatelliglobosispora scoriae]MBB5872404.1 hypothetical protein [Allocatelliglobosispora scoriae]
MIFSRQKSGRHAATAQQLELDSAARAGLDAAADSDGRGEVGPFDLSEAPISNRLDLGSLQVPAIDGVEIRVQADPDGAIQQVVLVFGESALQLGVFAAPRHEGIWDEIRDEIRKSLFNDGVAAEDVPGRYGIELRARVRTPDGLTDLRFVGVDGPRWLVRAVYQGPAAIDPATAEPLVACLEGLVVARGQDAKPAREPLPLRLPQEMADAAIAAGPQPAPEPEPAADQASEKRKPSPRPRR